MALGWYNASLALSASERYVLLREQLAEVGEGVVVRPPFHCDYGYNIRLGAGAFLNFNCIILDVVNVEIGAGTQIGPGVQILTADHPRDPPAHQTGQEFGRAFVAETGQTPAKAVERLRAETARRLVEDTNQPLEAIARATGFSDPERMRQRFIRTFGQPPQALRRAARAFRARDAA
jgi:hypothetical protein